MHAYPSILSRSANALRGLLVALLCCVAWPASGATQPPAPAELARRVEATLARCLARQHCEVNTCVSSGGLDSCYSQARQIWADQLARVEATLEHRAPWCAAHWDELKERQAHFSESALASASLGDGPYGTADDLHLLLSRQAYELAHGVLANSACRDPAKPVPGPKRRAAEQKKER